MHILQTVLYVFPKVLKRRICFTIKTFYSWWSFPLFSWPRCLIQEWYCKENSDASHHRGLKGWKSNVSHCSPPPPQKKKIFRWLHCTMHLNTNQVPSCSENLLDVTCRFFFSETLSCNRLLVQLYNASVQTTVSASFFVLLSLPSLPIHPPFPKKQCGIMVPWSFSYQHATWNGEWEGGSCH